ncbi:MAG: hypothetical protein SH850_28690 [Planctomycetaceae bacterium]|nr:hypothetical protein [Planctomycetaceae bacterium]
MNDGLTIQCMVHFRSAGHGRKELREGKAPVRPQPSSVPRVARLMALALRLEGLIRAGEVSDYAELARLGHVSRARITQLMNLMQLAPDLQETILFLPKTLRGRDPIIEHDLRPIAGEPLWSTQRRMWKRLVAKSR